MASGLSTWARRQSVVCRSIRISQTPCICCVPLPATFGKPVQPCGAQPAREIAEQSVAFDDQSLLAALNSLNRSFHSRALLGADLQFAAQAMSRLSYLVMDTTYSTDELSAKSMALIALAEAECGKAMPMEESLLAAHMGYSGAAASEIHYLPANDPWRLFHQE